jgi:hypothetical protein
MTDPNDDSPRSDDRRFQLLINAVTDYAIYMLDQTACAQPVGPWNICQRANSRSRMHTSTVLQVTPAKGSVRS